MTKIISEVSLVNIARDKYLRDLINRMNNGMIKVVTGIRRSGKSYLLFKLFYEYLLSQGVLESHIIKIELDQRKNRMYRDPDVILDYIETLFINFPIYNFADMLVTVGVFTVCAYLIYDMIREEKEKKRQEKENGEH